MEALDLFWDSLDAQFEEYAKVVSFPPDQVKYVLCLLLGYPLAFLMRLFPDIPDAKHIYSIVISLFFCRLCLGPWSWFPSMITSLICYWIVMLDSKYGGKDPIAHKVVFVVALLAMILCHSYRQYIDYMGWTLDFTGPQMVLTIKLQSFAFNWADGQRDAKQLMDHEKKAAIRELPSFLEFFGFVYFFPSFLAGPAVEIREYIEFTNMKMFEDKTCNGTIPNGAFVSLRSMFLSFLWVPFVILSSKFPVPYLATDAFQQAPFYEKLWRIYVHPSLCRARYYFGWNLSEGAYMACGFGYNGVDDKGKLKWDRAKNMNSLQVETAQNLRAVTSNWNMGTARWLKNYIYFRVTRPGERPSFFSTLATYVMSAVWHGFYPGYYLMFVSAGIATEAAKDMRRHVRPLFLETNGKPKSYKFVYDILSMLATSYTLNPLGAAFVLLNLRGLKVFESIYYLNILIPALAVVFFRFIFPLIRPRPRRQKRE